MPNKNKVPFRKAVCKLAHHSNIVCWLTEGLYLCEKCSLPEL